MKRLRYRIRKRIGLFFQDLFWNWEFQQTIERQAVQAGRKEMIYWITNKIPIEETIEFLKNEQEFGKEHWNLACFIDKKLSK